MQLHDIDGFLQEESISCFGFFGQSHDVPKLEKSRTIHKSIFFTVPKLSRSDKAHLFDFLVPLDLYLIGTAKA